jgi:ribosomal protein S18 acetylase RimI-like enzyme
MPLPCLNAIADKTLVVHCLMTGTPFLSANPYQRRGIGTDLARELIAWAEPHGWRAIEARAYHDIDVLYANTGQAGLRFWQRLGFQLAITHTEHPFRGEFLETMRRQAQEAGLDPDRITDRFTMRLEVGAEDSDGPASSPASTRP